MRRPVKPFVTEYKGNARRPSPQAGLSLKIEDETPSGPARSGASRADGSRADASRVTDSQRFAGLSLPSDESYEAALRAADALFSNGPARSEARSAPDDEAGETTAAAPATSTPSSNPAAGRILRVIDEAPSQALMDLEVEHTPKRRGRKPGSKNKPKVLAAFVEAPPETRAHADGAPVAAPPAPAMMAPDKEKPPIAWTAHREPPPAPARPVVAQRPRVEPYAWVRTKLKPGERWKRRLPKVAW